MACVTAGDQRWVLAVDVRPAASAPRTATADDEGVRAGGAAPGAVRAPAGDEQLVALARRVLDAVPAGPPFVGVVLGGADGSGAAGLAAVVARVTGRPPLG